MTSGTWLRVASGGVLLALLLLLYAGAYHIDALEHGRYSSGIRQLLTHESILNQHLMESSIDLRKNYDGIVVDIRDIDRIYAPISVPPTFFRDDTRRVYTRALEDYDRLRAPKIALTERFKTVNARLKNSERYFPAFSQQLLHTIRLMDADLHLAAVESVITILASATRDDSGSWLDARNAVTRLADITTKVDADTASDLTTLVQHAQMILDSRSELSEILDQLTTVSAQSRIRHLRDAYWNGYDQEQARTKPYFIALLTVVLLAFGGIAYIDGRLRYTMSRLACANEALEKTVAERTSELQYQNRDLELSRARARAVLDSSPDAIISLNMEGRILALSDRKSQVLGFSEPEIKNRMIAEAIFSETHVADVSMWIHSMQLRHQAGELPSEYRELSCVKNGGGVFDAEVSITVGESQGEAFFVCRIRDITERKRIERLKDEFVSVVSHELRTPLTSIRGAIGLVLGGAKGELNEDIASILSIASRNTERLSLLINDILDLQKIEAGKLDFSPRSVDLIDLLESSLNENTAYAQQHEISFRLITNTDDLHIWADPDRLRQVMANLLSNAAKFSIAGDEVLVDAAPHGQNMIRVTVSDHGEGIPEEFRASIFDRFTQANGSAIRKQGGTGLGLAICKSIMAQLDGRIDFESEIGKGTSFYIDIPIAGNQAT